jgi:hypothetical protein
MAADEPVFHYAAEDDPKVLDKIATILLELLLTPVKEPHEGSDLRPRLIPRAT